MKKCERKVEGLVYRRSVGKVEVLSLKRSVEDGGFWQPVTGTVDNDEELKETLLRELEEEAGITVIKSVSEIIHKFSWSTDKKECDEHVFAIEVPVETEIKLSHEHEDYAWADIEVLEFPMPDNQKALKKLKGLLKL